MYIHPFFFFHNPRKRISPPDREGLNTTSQKLQLTGGTGNSNRQWRPYGRCSAGERLQCCRVSCSSNSATCHIWNTCWRTPQEVVDGGVEPSFTGVTWSFSKTSILKTVGHIFIFIFGFLRLALCFHVYVWWSLACFVRMTWHDTGLLDFFFCDRGRILLPGVQISRDARSHRLLIWCTGGELLSTFLHFVFRRSIWWLECELQSRGPTL